MSAALSCIADLVDVTQTCVLQPCTNRLAAHFSAWLSANDQVSMLRTWKEPVELPADDPRKEKQQGDGKKHTAKSWCENSTASGMNMKMDLCSRLKIKMHR